MDPAACWLAEEWRLFCAGEYQLSYEPVGTVCRSEDGHILDAGALGFHGLVYFIDAISKLLLKLTLGVDEHTGVQLSSWSPKNANSSTLSY